MLIREMHIYTIATMWTINIFPERGGDTSLRITILDEKKTDRQVMQTLVLLIPHLKKGENVLPICMIF